MEFFKPNKLVMHLLQETQFTTAADMERNVGIGIVAVKATEFMEHAGITLGVNGLKILVDWYKQHLGYFPNISTVEESGLLEIRLVLEVEDGMGLEGVFLQFRKNRDRWVWTSGSINYAFGVTSKRAKMEGII